MLQITNMVKKYKKVTAVDGLSMKIDKGHIYGFVGANGAGKTTTMKIVAGLLKATSGKVYVNGIDIQADPGGVKKQIGYMPDFFGVYDDLRVDEYMDFYAGVYGIPADKRKKVCDDLVELVNLKDKMDAYVDSLSRGMKQRLCLARSLIHNPQLLILDEPASGLDPRARAEIKEILKELRDMGKTILISSHILPELSQLCTSIGIINAGKMVINGTVDEIMQRVSVNKVLIVKVNGEMQPAVSFLKEQPVLCNVTVSNDQISADFNGDDEQLARILAQMVERKIPVISFREAEKNLESIFMNLTVGGMKDAV